MTGTTLSPHPAPTRGGRRAVRRGGPRAPRREHYTALAMVSPAVVLLVLFIAVPVTLAFALAFTNARLISPTPARFVGLQNFTTLFSDPEFYRSLRNTAYFTVVIVPLQGGLALLLALLVNAKVRGTNFFRTVYFLPVVTSMVVISILWTFLYQKSGLVNHLISSLTLGHLHGPDWLNNPSTAMPAIIFMSVWQGVGFHMIIWLAGLQTIPGELYEAADLDGATRLQRFHYITWPGLRNTRTFVMITITIAAFSLFTQINVMTQGGPLDSTTTVVYQAVHAGFDQQQTAYASAISLVFFVIVLAVSMLQRYLTRERS